MTFPHEPAVGGAGALHTAAVRTLLVFGGLALAAMVVTLLAPVGPAIT